MAVADAADVILRRGHIARADAAERRMGAASECRPFAVGPVLEVVPRLTARARDIGDLVLPVAGRSSRSRLHKYISAASSSGASDQPERAISSFSGAFG